MSVKSKLLILLGVGLVVLLSTAVVVAVVPHEGGVDTANLQLLPVAGIDKPLGLAMDPDGSRAWVLGTTADGQFLLAALDTRTRDIVSKTALALESGTGFYCSVAASEEVVAIGWQEQVALLHKTTGAVRIIDLPKVQRLVDAKLLPVDPGGNQAIHSGVTDVLIQDRTVWVAREYANSLMAVAVNTGEVSELPLPASFGAPEELAFDGVDSLWLTSGLAYDASSPGPGGRVANDRIAEYSLVTGETQVYPMLALHIIPNAAGRIYVYGRGGISSVDLDGTGGIQASRQHVAIEVGDRDEILLSPTTGELSVLTRNGVLRFDGSGQRVGQASSPPRRTERPSLPAPGVGAEPSDAGVSDGTIAEVQPLLKDGAIAADGSTWMVVPNYGKIGIALP